MLKRFTVHNVVSILSLLYFSQISIFIFQTRKSDCEKKNKRPRNVYIGNSHTVSGHEASDLAKRLSEELAIHQQTVNRSTSPDYEIRPRSLEQKHYKKTGMYICVWV